jgi:hypothetical protein
MERYPNSLVWVLAQVNDGDEQFWKEKFHAANGKAQHSQTVQFFSCGHRGEGTGGGREGFCSFPFFPMCSHHVPIKFPNMFLKMFSIAPRLYPIWFAQSVLLVNCIGGPKKLYILT